MSVISTTLQVAGAVAVTVGVGLLSIPIGIIVGGVFAIVIGLALGR
jgi:hypothetical protein